MENIDDGDDEAEPSEEEMKEAEKMMQQMFGALGGGIPGMGGQPGQGAQPGEDPLAAMFKSMGMQMDPSNHDKK